MLSILNQKKLIKINQKIDAIYRIYKHIIYVDTKTIKRNVLKDKKVILERYVDNLVKIQTMQILSGQIDMYNFNRVLALCRKYYLKEDSLKFDRVIQYYFSQEKKKYLAQLYRIKKHKAILDIQKRYPLTDVVKLAYYLSLQNKLSLKSKDEFTILEDIIKINLSIPLFDRTNVLNTKDINIDQHINLLNKSEKIKTIIKENITNLNTKQG